MSLSLFLLSRSSALFLFFVLLFFMTSCGGVSQVPLRRVVLFQNGIGYFERSGELDDEELRLRFRPHEADDALKTLIVVDRNSSDGDARRQPLTVSAVVPQPRERRNGDGDDDEGHENDTLRGVDLSVHLSRPPSGELFVAYAVPTPTWRAVYRVVLPDASGSGQGLLQAFALINNVSDEDWDDIELVLATGAPFTYAIDLRTPRFVPRPDVTGRLVEPPVIGAVLSEQSRQGTSGDDDDGVPAATDLCPSEPEDLDRFEDGDGCPDPDNDEDRILDHDDECPNEPEVYNGIEDEDGCPDRGRVMIEGSNIVIMDRIYFVHNSGEIHDRSGPILDAIAATMRGNPQVTLVEICGHAANNERDSWGLSSERANAVRGFLIREGIVGERLQVRPYGATQPVASGTEESARERNRRVEFLITETTAGPTGARPAASDQTVTVETLGQSVGPIVEAEEAPEGTRYRIEELVSVPAGSSTLITLVNRPLPAEDVLLFRPDDAAPGSDRHPLRAARLENETGLDLVAGPLSIFSEGSFVGEGLMGRVVNGDSTFVPYALDESTWVRAEVSAAVEPHQIIALERGVLVVEDTRVRRSEYRLDVGQHPPARVFVRHGRTQGYEIQELPPGTEDTIDGFLIPVPIGAERLTVLPVVEHRRERRRIRLLDDDRVLIASYLEASDLDDEATTGLRRLIELRAQLRDIGEQSHELRAQLTDLGADMAEIRSSLAATEAERRATADLRRRLLARLEEATEQRSGLSTRLAELTARRATHRAELSEVLRALTIEERERP